MSGESSKLTYKKRKLCGYNIWHREFLQSAGVSTDVTVWLQIFVVKNFVKSPKSWEKLIFGIKIL